LYRCGKLSKNPGESPLTAAAQRFADTLPGNPHLGPEDEKTTCSVTAYVLKQLDFTSPPPPTSVNFDLCGASSVAHSTVQDLVHRLNRFKALGNTAFQRCEYVDAEQCYQNALEGPELECYVSNKINNTRPENPETNADSFYKACSEETGLPRLVAVLHTNLANAQLKLGRKSEALENSLRATQLDTGYAKGFFKLAEVSNFQGDSSLALQAIQSASALAPKDPAVKELMRKIAGA